jgi:hypothetical protein
MTMMMMRSHMTGCCIQNQRITCGDALAHKLPWGMDGVVMIRMVVIAGGDGVSDDGDGGDNGDEGGNNDDDGDMGFDVLTAERSGRLLGPGQVWASHADNAAIR